MSEISITLSDHFSFREATFSETAERLHIDNSLPEKLIPAATKTARGLERIRALLGFPININSWFRCEALQSLPQFHNPTSQHPKAEAVDWTCAQFGSPLECCKKIIKYSDLIRFDQLILEHSWVHVSFCSDPTVKPRGQVLSLLNSGGYATGLTDKEGIPL